MVTYGRQVETNGIEALTGELWWTAGHVEYLRVRVQALAPEALTWGVSRRADDALLGSKETWDAGTHALVKLYLEERRHLVQVAKDCVTIGLDERRIRLEEQKGVALVEGLRWLFAELRLSVEQLELANALAVAMLRALHEGRPPGSIEGTTT